MILEFDDFCFFLKKFSYIKCVEGILLGMWEDFESSPILEDVKIIGNFLN